ncbi:MAG: hypothetical protein ACN4GZ_15505 [Acidimicrobiales bacterium]
MSARRQGRATTLKTVSIIDELTCVLGSVEMDPVTSLRRVPPLLERLGLCLALLDSAQEPESSEALPYRSLESQLGPVTDMVLEPNVIPPPFGPDLRQRVSYATAQLSAMRQRLKAANLRIPGKVVRALAGNFYRELRERWSDFRTDPSLTNLERLETSACHLAELYDVLGIRPAEPRVKGLRKLCELLQRASDREGELDDVPGLLRQVTAKANELSRPTVAEHRQWIESVL